MNTLNFRHPDFQRLLAAVLAILSILGLVVGGIGSSSRGEPSSPTSTIVAPSSSPTTSFATSTPSISPVPSLTPTLAPPLTSESAPPLTTQSVAATSSPVREKTVPLPLTAGDGDSNGMRPRGSYRIPLNYSPSILTWRIAFSMRAPRSEKIHPGKAIIHQVTVGEHDGDGHFLSQPKTIGQNLQLPTNGEAAYSDWQHSELGGSIENLIAFDYTTTAGTPPGNVGGGWTTYNATATDLDPETLPVNQIPFDIWLEVKVAKSVPVLAAIGDSITAGVGADKPIYDAWATQFARTNNALATLYATSGDSGENWVSNPASYKVSRFTKDHLSKPNAVVWAMGRNDFSMGTTPEEMITTTLKAEEIIKETLQAPIYAATITPRETRDDSTVFQYNSWLKTESPFTHILDFESIVHDGKDGIKDEFDADGLHFNTAGYRELALEMGRSPFPS